MTLAQVQAAVAVIVALMVSLTGLLTSTAVLLPVHTRKAGDALDMSLKRCLLTGLAMAFLVVVGFVLLNLPVPLLKLAGIALLLGVGALLLLGGAGVAQLMGRRISEMSGAQASFGAVARGSIAYSVGVFFPLIGWFIFAPLSILCALGAGVAALRPVSSTTTHGSAIENGLAVAAQG